jgi:hypothetical protein
MQRQAHVLAVKQVAPRRSRHHPEAGRNCSPEASHALKLKRCGTAADHGRARVQEGRAALQHDRCVLGAIDCPHPKRRGARPERAQGASRRADAARHNGSNYGVAISLLLEIGHSVG